MTSHRFPRDHSRHRLHGETVDSMEDRKEYFRTVTENLEYSGIEMDAGILSRIRHHWAKSPENRPSPYGAALKIKNSLS